MLWIIEKFDDVEPVVVAFDQMGLSAASHLSDHASRVNGHQFQREWLRRARRRYAERNL